MGLLEKILTSDLVQGTIADGALEVIDKIQSKLWYGFENKLYKKYPDSSFIWATMSSSINILLRQNGEICYYDISGEKKYISKISISMNSVKAIIYKNDGSVIWEIDEKKGKKSIFKGKDARDLEVFQFNKKIGEIKVLSEKGAILFFDFLDWTVYETKDAFQTITKDGTIVCENYFRSFNKEIGCIVHTIKSIDELLVMINTAIVINLIAKNRGQEKRQDKEFKKQYKEFKKEYRKGGGGW